MMIEPIYIMHRHTDTIIINVTHVATYILIFMQQQYVFVYEKFLVCDSRALRRRSLPRYAY